MYVPRLRKLQQVLKEIKNEDKNSAMTSYLLYVLVHTQKITPIKFGNEWIINLDELYEFFKTKEKNNEKNDFGTNTKNFCKRR